MCIFHCLNTKPLHAEFGEWFSVSVAGDTDRAGVEEKDKELCHNNGVLM